MTRALRGAVVCGLAVAAVVAVPASPASAAACPGTGTGVTVVVDFSVLGGGVQVACAPGDPATGLAALSGAGLSTTGTQRDGPGFVCRIDGLPTPEADACVVTPPTDAYWAYWYAPRGGSWTYSSLGPAGRDPAPGTVEGWAFGAGVQPGAAPPPAPPPPPPPDPPDDPPDPADDPPAGREPPPAGEAPGGEAPAGPGDPAAGPGSGEPASRPPRAGASSPAVEPPTPPVSSSVDGSTGSAATGTAAPAVPVAGVGSDRGGGPLGVVTGAALVAAVAVAGWWVARRRRYRPAGAASDGGAAPGC